MSATTDQTVTHSNATPTKANKPENNLNLMKPAARFSPIPTDSILVGPAFHSPSKVSLSDESSHTGVTDLDDDFDASTMIKAITKSDHKIAEERGFHVAEPLLRENPHRFVLFPIEDDEVRRVLFYESSFLFCCNSPFVPTIFT